MRNSSEQLTLPMFDQEEELEPITLSDIIAGEETYSFEQFRIALEREEAEAKSNPKIVVKLSSISFAGKPVPDIALLIYKSAYSRDRNGKHYVVSYDTSGDVEIELASEWLVRVEDPTDYFPDYLDQLDKNFWESAPTDLLHGTSDLQFVLKNGIVARSGSRGISRASRSVGDAVYLNPSEEYVESYASGPDGGVVKVDFRSMKGDYLKSGKALPFASEEPDVIQYDLMGAMASVLGIGDTFYPDEPSDMDPETVIVYGSIPAKYLSVHSRNSDE